MNRSQRRNQPPARVEIAGTLKLHGQGTVPIGGAVWSYVFGGAYVLAHAVLKAADGLRSLAPAQDAVARSYLTREVESVASITRDSLTILSDGMRAEEKRCGRDGVFEVGGVPFAWKLLRTGLALMGPTESASFSLASGEVLRVDTPTMRLAIMRCVPVQGAPGCAILDRAQMDAIESSRGDA